MTESMASELTNALLATDRYGSKSFLRQRVDGEIRAMADKIAIEIVAEHPALGEQIRELTRQAIREALRNDTYLNSMVVDAVARTLSTVALERVDEQ